MTDTQPKHSEAYVYNLSRGQMEALLAIAKERDCPFLEIVMEAVNQYIEREKASCREKMQ